MKTTIKLNFQLQMFTLKSFIVSDLLKLQLEPYTVFEI